MANIHLLKEQSRGCGFRSEGGFYLRCEGKGIHCGFLPINLPEKPAIPAGKKSDKEQKKYFQPSRGPRWVKVGDIIPESHDCNLPNNPFIEGGCQGCWVRSIDRDMDALLIWVGMSYYKTTSLFDKEAGRVGISRKIPPHIIPRIKVGKTPVFLAHREGSNILNTQTGEVTTIRQVFRIFIPSVIEHVVKPNILKLDKRTKAYKEYVAYLDELEAQGITLVQVEKLGTNLKLDLPQDN